MDTPHPHPPPPPEAWFPACKFSTGFIVQMWRDKDTYMYTIISATNCNHVPYLIAACVFYVLAYPLHLV